MLYLILPLGLIFSFFHSSKEDEQFKLLYFFLILALIAFFRYGIGADYFAYQYLYERLQPSVIDEFRYGLDPQEPVFRSLGAIMKVIGLNYQMYLSVIASISLYYIYRFCREFSSRPVLSATLYYSFYYMVWILSGLRQGLTLSIGTYYMIACIREKNLKKLILISVLLSFLHVSALMMIPFYFLGVSEIKIRHLLYILAGSIVFTMLPLGTIINYIDFLPLINRISPYFNDTGLLSFLDFPSLARLSFLAVFLVHYKNFEDDKFLVTLFKVYIGSLIVYFLLKFSELTAARMSLYGRMVEILLFASIFYLKNLVVNKKVYFIGLIVLSGLYLNKEVNTMERQTGMIVEDDTVHTPYISIFNKEDVDFDNRLFHLMNEW